MRAETNERVVCCVRCGLAHERATPRVPLPDEVRLTRERFGRGQLLRPVLRPQAGLRLTKRGQPALPGYAGPGQHGNVPRGAQQHRVFRGYGDRGSHAHACRRPPFAGALAALLISNSLLAGGWARRFEATREYVDRRRSGTRRPSRGTGADLQDGRGVAARAAASAAAAALRTLRYGSSGCSVRPSISSRSTGSAARIRYVPRSVVTNR